MFAAGLADVFHDRILIVEDDADAAETLVRFVRNNGGEVVGPVACAKDAVAAIRTHPGVDSAMVAADLRDDLLLPLVRQLERRHVSIIWVVGHDGWFAPDAGAEDVCVYRLAEDPQCVMRVKKAD